MEAGITIRLNLGTFCHRNNGLVMQDADVDGTSHIQFAALVALLCVGDFRTGIKVRIGRRIQKSQSILPSILYRFIGFPGILNGIQERIHPGRTHFLDICQFIGQLGRVFDVFQCIKLVSDFLDAAQVFTGFQGILPNLLPTIANILQSRQDRVVEHIGVSRYRHILANQLGILADTDQCRIIGLAACSTDCHHDFRLLVIFLIVARPFSDDVQTIHLNVGIEGNVIVFTSINGDTIAHSNPSSVVLRFNCNGSPGLDIFPDAGEKIGNNITSWSTARCSITPIGKLALDIL